MKRSALPRLTSRRAEHPTDPPLTLGDIVEALCASMPPANSGIEYFLDRLERQK
ncbi:hypothetical protein RYZ20_04975 [Thioclava sp. A2]|uniref:hypothetical protein n=1 Tax=Thioclava sp. FCG-A2 TaxID=3080562 RepID=UPI0029542A02|nr:hypothetical protein [Thioclava sp. A2]MDV7270249.1 hypothetical protein [Thioclava sp. A2]